LSNQKWLIFLAIYRATLKVLMGFFRMLFITSEVLILGVLKSTFSVFSS